jgi:hypothetical protein
LFILNLAVGVLTVAAISLSPLYAERLRLLKSVRIGATLVLASVAVGAASASTVGEALPGKDVLFFCLFAALLAGSVMILAGGGDDPSGDGNGGAGGDPPWWPEFEAGFRRYSRQPRHPVGRR